MYIKIRKARKEYICAGCDLEIIPGEEYCRMTVFPHENWSKYTTPCQYPVCGECGNRYLEEKGGL